MHFSSLRLRKKSNNNTVEPPPMEIGAPTSQPFDYGPAGIAPWMNDYDVHHTERVNIPHAARKNIYHTKHEYVPPNYARSCSTSSIDVKLTTPIHNPNHPPPLLQIPTGLSSGASSDSGSETYSEVPKTPVKKRRMRFFRNRGINERGQLADEWEEIYDADWGCPDEYTRNRRKWYE